MILISLFLTIVFYLAGVFAEWSFSPIHWSVITRLALVIAYIIVMGGVIASNIEG